MHYQPKPVDVVALAAAYGGGLSLKEAGLKFGISGTTVATKLRDAGVTIRDHLGRAKPAVSKATTVRKTRPCLGCGAQFVRTERRWFQCAPCAARSDV